MKIESEFQERMVFGLLSKESPIGKIIDKETKGQGVGYYYPEEFKLVVHFIGATEEQTKRLLLLIQNHIDLKGLWRSFDNILIMR